jgi:IS6 family transposase
MHTDSPFKWRQFEPELILLCVRRYLRYALSYRDLEEMMRERGLSVDHTTPPRVANVDKNSAYSVAFDAIKQEGLVRPSTCLRQCKYLNNVIEQDHRFIKRRTRPMLGFNRFHTAWRTLRGIEMMNALRKGQARWIANGDVVGQRQLIHRVFGLAA